MIDIEKFICSLLADHLEGVAVRGDIHRALKEQGLEYKDGKIVPIEDKTELKEYEDGRIKKEIVRFIQMEVEDEIVGNKWLAWLEKQGQTFTKKDVDDAWLKGMCDAKHELEKQGEQKSVEWGKEKQQIIKDAASVILSCVNTADTREEEERLEELADKLQDLKPHKQGEPKSAERKDFISIPFGAFDSELINETITIPDGCVATIEGNKIHIKKKGKSATEAIKLNHTVDNNEMVESTFNAGDWVVRKNGETFCNGSKFAQIESIELDGEMCYLDTGRWLYPSEIRPWTIQDAKDGDVLSYVTDEENLWIMIYWSLYKPYEGHVHYHALLVNDNFADKGTCCICIDNLKPATKEQRDILFQKMEEAGYEWDSEKKEVIKINLN